MRWLVLGLLLCGAPALAQQLPTQPPVTLTISVEQAMLIDQTLGQIGCANVQQLMVCMQALDLRSIIHEQVKAQDK